MSTAVEAFPAAQIRLRIRELSQLFNSLDPSPFLDRDLDRDAEEFIVSWAQELPTNREVELNIQLAAVPVSPVPAVTQAVHHYFQNRAMMKRRELSRLFRMGRMSLAVGLLFLAACLFLSEWVLIGATTLSAVIKESLIIVGWVALWRPLEIYLYDWWPLRADLKVLERLARAKVRVTLPDGSPCVLAPEPPVVAQ
ncbi:MAG TPA: hypothetical protein PLN52_05505 [Opitutaceae bacterium]|nr:hypothetical protein [Opitutaceae bacterium]